MLGLAGRRRALARVSAFALVATVLCAPAESGSASTTTLAITASTSNRYFGTYLDAHGLANAGYQQRLGEFSLIEAWSSWTELEPCDGCWQWSALDGRMATIAQTGATAKSTALIWGHAIAGKPNYVTPAYLSTLDATQLRAVMKLHIQTMIRRYPQVKVWTIANEPFQNPNAYGWVGMYSNPFRRTLGPAWIREALIDAYQANPNATYIAVNEINADGTNPKSTFMYDYYRQRILGAIPTSHLAVGLQMHLDSCPGVHLNPGVWDIGGNMYRFNLLGVQVHITEMDFPVSCAGTTVTQQLTAQANKFHDVAIFCAAIPRCRAMSVWGVGDADSWYRWQLGTTEDPLLFDDNYQPKPAYFGVIDGLNRR